MRPIRIRRKGRTGECPTIRGAGEWSHAASRPPEQSSSRRIPDVSVIANQKSAIRGKNKAINKPAQPQQASHLPGLHIPDDGRMVATATNQRCPICREGQCSDCVAMPNNDEFGISDCHNVKFWFEGFPCSFLLSCRKPLPDSLPTEMRGLGPSYSLAPACWRREQL